jgi:hypothetical protein
MTAILARGNKKVPSVNSTDGTGCGSPDFAEFDATGAILAAQCDGLIEAN